MKKKNFFFLVTFVFMLLSCTEKENHYEWKDISFDKDIHLSSICMINDETGFVGGTVNYEVEDRIIHYTVPSPFCCDSIVFSPDNEYFYKKFVFKEDQSIDPILYKTTNGGIGWQAIQTPFKTGIQDIHFIDENTGYVVTNYEGVYKTTDGGSNWLSILGNMLCINYSPNNDNSYQDMYRDDPFKSVYFLNENTGFVYGNDIVLKTIDGGISWITISVNYSYGLVSENYPSPFSTVQIIDFSNSMDTGYLVNGKSELYITLNQGSDWELVYDGPDNFLEPVFYNSKVVFLPYQKLYTQNAGNNWIESPLPRYDSSPVTNFAKGMVTTNSVDFYYEEASGIRKTIFGSDGYLPMSQETDHGWIIEFDFPSENVGYAIGSESLILKYTKSNLK